MPARAERIHLYSEIPDQPNRTIDFPAWWNRSHFFFKFGDREYDTGNPIDVNYAYKLTSEEALAFDEYCRKRAYPNPKRIRPLVKINIENFIEDIKTAKWVIIESYEWESGYS